MRLEAVITSICTSQPMAAASLDHMDYVSSVNPCDHLLHVVSASRDCHVKVCLRADSFIIQDMSRVCMECLAEFGLGPIQARQ